MRVLCVLMVVLALGLAGLAATVSVQVGDSFVVLDPEVEVWPLTEAEVRVQGLVMFVWESGAQSAEDMERVPWVERTVIRWV